MTSYFKQPIVCECGHKGFVRLSELNHPFGVHDHYWLDGFIGDDLTFTRDNCANKPKDILSALTPKCPQCGRVGAASALGQWKMEVMAVDFTQRHGRRLP